MAPTGSSKDPDKLYSCYKSEDTWFEEHEWEKHGRCAGVKDAGDFFTQVCAMAEKPLAVMEGVRVSGGDTSDAADQLQRSGYCVFGLSSQSQIMLSACAGSDGVWKLADVGEFPRLCAWSGHIPPSTPSPSAHSASSCVPNTHGPSCDTDADCDGIHGCVRCAHSGYCTDVPLS